MQRWGQVEMYRGWGVDGLGGTMGKDIGVFGEVGGWIRVVDGCAMVQCEECA